MATQEWVCILPDHPNVLAKRNSVRKDHLAMVKGLVQQGIFVLGGASLDEPLKEGEDMKMNGSVAIVRANTEDEVLELLKQSVYYTEGIWNPTKFQIIPYSCSFRTAL